MRAVFLGLLGLAALSGCGLVQVRGGVGTSSSSGGSGGSSGGAASSGEDDAKLAAFYAKVDYKNAAAEDQSDTFKHAGFPRGYNPRLHAANPDPAWILGWEALHLTDETQLAVLQAAANKTWTPVCHADFVAYRGAWKKIEDAHRAELTALSAPGNYYARAKGLAALLATVTQEATDAKVLFAPGHPQSTVGIRSEIVHAMAALSHEGKRDFVSKQYFDAQKVNVSDYKAYGRPFAADDVEQDLYCEVAMKLGTNRTPELPRVASGSAAAAVRWPVQEDREQAIHATRDALVASAAAPYAFESTGPGSVAGGSSPSGPEATLYRVFAEGGDPNSSSYDGAFVVKSFKKSGDKASFEIEQKSSRSIPYDCQNSGVSFSASGERMQHALCKYRHHEMTTAIVVDFSELPPGIEPKPGDVIGFYGDLLSRSESPNTGNAARSFARTTMAFNGRHIEYVKRGTQVVYTD